MTAPRETLTSTACGLHPADQVAADQAPGLVGQRAADHDGVAAREQISGSETSSIPCGSEPLRREVPSTFIPKPSRAMPAM